MEDKKPTVGEMLATGKTDAKFNPYTEALARAAEEYQEGEEKYLKDLASKLSVSKKKNFLISRNIVMDVHLRLEFLINTCINICCAIGAIDYKLKPDADKISDSIAEIDFLKKVKIAKSLTIVKASTISCLIKINNLRVAFAHGYSTDHKKYDYCGASIFEKSTITKLIQDYEEIHNELWNGKILGAKKDEQ